MPENTPGYEAALAAAEHHTTIQDERYVQELADQLTHLCTTITRPRSWRLELPAEMTLVNANDRRHPVKQAPFIKVIRHAAWAMARHHKLPPLQRAHVFYVVHPDTKTRRRDPGNWSPSAKAAVDGLVDAGVLPDDNKDHLLGPDPRSGEPVKGSQLVLWITDMDQMDPAHLALLNPPTTLPGATR